MQLKRHNFRWSRLKIQVLTVLVILSTIHLGAQDRETNIERGDRGPGLTLRLSASRQSYASNDPIQLTAVLLNETQEPIWVDKPLGFVKSPGGFTLKIWDQDGRSIEGPQFFVDAISPFTQKMELYDWIRQTKLSLFPGDFLGSTATIQSLGFRLPGRGRYRLQVSYACVGLDDLGIDRGRVEKVKKQARFQVWSGELHSPDIWIEVAE
jgi:hypothetical protein